MRLHRFFVKHTLREGSHLSLDDGALVHQWRNVFRFKVGDVVILLDNSGFEFVARISDIGKKKATVEVIESKPCRAQQKKGLCLCISLVKKDKFEWIVEKGTELGVSHFVPLISDRSEKRNLNFERLEKIAREASEQSERGTLPTFSPILDVAEAVGSARTCFDDRSISLTALHHEAKRSVPRSLMDSDTHSAVFVGPEGGWSDDEREIFKREGVNLLSLGHQVLRAETAALAIATLLLLPSRDQ